MATNYNQFKDTTVYGNFNNSNKASPSLTAEATFDGTITGKNNIYCNGDLYVGKITETTDPTTGIVSNVITGGEIYSKGNNINTLYQSKEISTDPYLTSSIASTTYQVKGNYLTSASLVSPTFSGTPKSTTPATTDNTTNIATTAYVKSNLTLYALLASPTFSGTPKSTTPATTDNTTNIATTAYVKSNLSSYVTNSTLGTTIGPYLTSATALNLYLQIATASTTYQPKGNYLTTASFDNYITTASLATSLNSYLTTATAGDLYLLKTSNWVSSTGLTTQLANYLSLTNASATYQPKGNYLTTASFDNYLPLSGGTMNGALTTTILNIKGQTIDGQISCIATTDGIFYKSGQNHMFNVDNGTVSVFAIETSGVNTTKPILSYSTINAVQGLQENGITLSSKYAPLLSPTFTGAPKSTTQLTTDNSTNIATTAFVKSNLTSYATKVSPTFSGTPKSTTPLTADNTTNIATTAYVKSNLALYALLASPTFSGTPKSTTPLATDTTTRIATCQWVKNLNYAPSPVITRLSATVLPFITSNTVHSFKFDDKFVILPPGKYIITYNIRFIGTPISQMGYAPITVTKLIFGLCRTATEINTDDDLGLGANMKLNFTQLLTNGPTQFSGTFIGDHNSLNANGSIFFNVTPTWTGTGLFKMTNATLTYVKIADTTSVFIPFVDEGGDPPVDPPITVNPIPFTEVIGDFNITGNFSESGIPLNYLFQAKEEDTDPYITTTALNTILSGDITVGGYLSQGGILLDDLYQTKETALDPYITKTDLKGFIYPSTIRIANTSTTTLVGINALYFTPSADIYISVRTSNNAMVFSANGYYFNNNNNNVAQITTTGSYVTVSDRRLKKNIIDLSHGLDEILQLNSVSYQLLEEEEDEPLHIGFIAQDVKEIMPELVTEIGDYSGIQYTSLIPVLVNAIKELSSQVDTLKAILIKNNIK